MFALVCTVCACGKPLKLCSNCYPYPLVSECFAAIRGCSFATLPCVVIDVCCVAKGKKQAAQMLPHAVGC